ncbi:MULTISPECIES: N-acetylglucosamine kinase [Pseudoalteromonas]|uniref:ATPase n=1 Tax=Pseudoalteromonas ruthenica TaxID=151081 RepID=A0A0F4Q1S3_9GAMM|nr:MULTISPECIES: BadF/BadG/BcrA/BcrD ATPase family protein [Pseudoalteromonas]KJZ00672.1 ATPase [Pseudoalteromonas ruthenica]KJZ01274.1 ATPase [Pseudoalteromonas ruthenica]MCF2862936.1 ATPase [Pseudoalteromonas sp. CNAT2-18]MCG7559088.1 ATPase [Pseudoalteromonas sp. CNAT2-18.1]MCG7566724.1 ATPase [Pseudoalteromonas sp. CnMc7-15]|tara:strand:- start:2261 stop:3178 length:918 start_codon:yes stop_codon:yes gene_type:complete
MMAKSASQEQLFIGIDGGGTKCRATIYSAQRGVLGTGLGGPANPLHGLERTLESIMVSTQQAMRDAGLRLESVHQLVAGLGLAGVNLPSLFEKISEWEHPFQKMYLTTDLHTACIGAHEGGDGAVIITGTGSCGFACVKGHSVNYGGHGFAQGDKGSGAWLGLEALKAVLLDLDGLGPQTRLSEMFKLHFNASSAMGVAEQMAGQPSSSYAKLARMVIEAAHDGDMVALTIVKDGARYISNLAKRLLEINPPRLSMIGGLSEPMQKWLDPDIAKRVEVPRQPPEMGAVYFAQNALLEEEQKVAIK